MATRGGNRRDSRVTLPERLDRRTESTRSSTRTAGRRNSDEVRQALLAAASQLFVQSGFAATSYLDIASTASTSESALFRHFRSKSNLLIEAVLEPFAEALDSVSRRWAEVAPEIRRARQPEFVADLYLTLLADRQLLRILMGVANDPAHSDLNAAVSARFARTFEQLLAQQEAQTDHEHSYQPETRLRAALAMITGAAVLDDWFLSEADGIDPARTISAISELISRGRRPPDSARRS